MRIRDRSYGVIPLKRVNGKWNVFLVCHTAGHWSFPKGHPEPEETPLQSAIRELKEETHLDAKALLFPDPIQEEYEFKSGGKIIEKKVLYYIMEAKGEANLQQEEISDGKWLSLEEAHRAISFEADRNVLSEVAKLLT